MSQQHSTGGYCSTLTVTHVLKIKQIEVQTLLRVQIIVVQNSSRSIAICLGAEEKKLMQFFNMKIIVVSVKQRIYLTTF